MEAVAPSRRLSHKIGYYIRIKSSTARAWPGAGRMGQPSRHWYQEALGVWAGQQDGWAVI